MKALKKILEDIKKEITYDINGEGYISQRGVSRLIGVARTTVQYQLKKHSATLKTNENNQLHEGSLLHLLRSIGVNNAQVLEIVKQIEVMGVRSVFHGVATPVERPMTQLETFEHLVKMEKERLVMLEQIVVQKVTIDEDAILTNKSDEYYPVSHVRNLNSGIKISGMKLSETSTRMGLEVKQLYSNYEATTANTYHGTVWLALYPDVKL